MGSVSVSVSAFFCVAGESCAWSGMGGVEVVSDEGSSFEWSVDGGLDVAASSCLLDSDSGGT